MVHNIYVCLEHKKIWHSLRAAGIHAYHKHKENRFDEKGHGGYLVLLEKGIYVDMGVCPQSERWRGRAYACDLKMRDATEEEIVAARQRLAYQRQLKEQSTDA